MTKRRTVVPALVIAGALSSSFAFAAPARLVIYNFYCSPCVPCPATSLPPKPTVVQPGQLLSVTVLAVDSTGSLDYGFRGTLRITSSDPLAVFPPDVAFGGCMAMFPASFGTVGQRTITATDISGAHLPGSFQWRVTNLFGTIPTTSKPVELLFALGLAGAAWTVLRRSSA